LKSWILIVRYLALPALIAARLWYNVIHPTQVKRRGESLKKTARGTQMVVQKAKLEGLFNAWQGTSSPRIELRPTVTGTKRKKKRKGTRGRRRKEGSGPPARRTKNLRKVRLRLRLTLFKTEGDPPKGAGFFFSRGRKKAKIRGNWRRLFGGTERFHASRGGI